MSLKIDRLQLEIIINNDQARKSLRLLDDEIRALKKELVKNKSNPAEYKRINDLLKTKIQQHDKIIDSLGIEKLTLKELGQRYKELSMIKKNLDPNLPAYKQLEKQLIAIKNRQNELNGAATKTGMSFSKMADGFNKYFAILTAGAATLTGLVMGMRKAVDVFNVFEKSVDHLSALTGLVGDDLAWLSEEAKKMSTATIEGNIRIASSATEIVDAYTKVGSKRPELLKVKEDLAAVTQEAMILAAAADGELQPAVDGLSMVLNQFNVPASESRKIINVLAAGSLEGAGEIDYLTAGFEKAGSVASSFGISIEELTGILETLAPRITEPEMAGRSLRNIMIKLETQSDDKLKPSIVGLAGAFEYMKETQWDVTKMTDLFGTENINAANILINNTAETKKYTLAVTDTNVALRQAAINTDNNATKLKQAQNAVELLTIEFGQKLAPAMTFSTNAFAYFMRAVMDAPAFIVKYQIALIALTAAYLAYHGAVIQATLVKIYDNVALKQGIGLKIKDAVVLEALIIKEKLLSIWKGQGTIATKLATTAQWLWNAAVAANPIGLLIAGIAALVVAIKMYDKYNAESLRLEREKQIAIDNLTTANNNLHTSFMKQEDAISQLNKMSIEQKQNLYEQTKATLSQAEAELVLFQATQKRIEQDNTRTTMWQNTLNLISAFSTTGDLFTYVDAAKNGKEAADQMNESIAAMQSNIKQLYTQSSGLDNILNSEKIADAITGKTINDLEDKQRALTTALKNTVKGSDEYIRISKKLSEVNKELNINTDDLTSKTLESIDAYSQLTNEIAALEKELKNLVVANKPVPDSLIHQIASKKAELERINETIAQIGEGLKLIARGPGQIPLPDDNQTIGTRDNTEKPSPDIPKPKLNDEDKQAIEEATLDVAQITSDAMFQIGADRRAAELDAELSKLDQLRDHELSNKNLTEKQKDAINKKYAAKEAQLKKEAWEKDKKAAITQAIINGVISIAKTFATMGWPAGIPLAAISAAATIAQIAVISSQKAPQFAEGNYQDILAQDGKTYQASVTNNRHKSGLFSKPTFVPGFGLFGETVQPELVFNPKDTTAIMNSPGLINAINHTLGGARQFAQGNYQQISKESNTTMIQSDPELKDLLAKLKDYIKTPPQAFLVSNEEYLRKQKEAMSKYEAFISKK